jgi:hypothetical protein
MIACRRRNPIILRHETIVDFLNRGVQHEAIGAETALRAARQRNYRRTKPRADGC